MSATTYPNLGFDPCPGSTIAVTELHQEISTAASSMQSANDLMNRLRNDTSGAWQGTTADAFRTHLNSTLIDDLGSANQSLNRAVTALQEWEIGLAGFQQQAAALESQAASAQRTVNAADTAHRNAEGNPDLRLASQQLTTDADLRDAQQRLNVAELALRNTTADMDAAVDALDIIRRHAHDLNDEWDTASSKAAAALKEAAGFSPHKAGLLNRLGHDLVHLVDGVDDWVKNHLEDIHSVLSTVSAVAGLIALCTPPPIDAIAFAVAVVAGVGALATTLADPKMRSELGGLLHGNFAGNWHAGLQLTGDVLGLVPGAGAGVKMVKTGNLMADAGRGFPTIVDIASRTAHNPGYVMRKVAESSGGIGTTLQKFKLMEASLGVGGESALAQKAEATADMLNFINKTRGGIQKTATTTWNEVTGGGNSK